MSMRYIAWTLLQLWIKIILVTYTTSPSQWKHIYTWNTNIINTSWSNTVWSISTVLFTLSTNESLPVSTLFPKLMFLQSIDHPNSYPQMSVITVHVYLSFITTKYSVQSISCIHKVCAAFNHVYCRYCPGKSCLPYSCTSWITSSNYLVGESMTKAKKLFDHGPI